MKSLSLFVASLLILVSCSKTDTQPAGSDSLLSKPTITEQMPPMISRDTSSGLIIDQSSLRTPQHEALLQRFSAVDVAKIYRAFKEIRKPGITEEQTTKFLKDHKITLDELKAILEEGDILGWGKR